MKGKEFVGGVRVFVFIRLYLSKREGERKQAGPSVN
jgi:hypothetical protein